MFHLLRILTDIRFIFIAIFMAILPFKAVCAWNSAGHRIIAEIAFDNLKPEVRLKISEILRQTAPDFMNTYNIRSASTWPDRIKQYHLTRYNSWHYIAKPFSNDGMKLAKINEPNLLTALDQIFIKFNQGNLNSYEEGFYLRFLIHLVGDAHQPTHCATLVNQMFPYSDLNGNRYKILTRHGENLHALWDNGVGYFHLRFKRHGLRDWQVRMIARDIERRYDKEYFLEKMNSNFSLWIDDCFMIDKNVAYTIPPNTKPTKVYIKQSQKIVERQLALAGYRLAYLLNQRYQRRNTP